jgi:hypothetical protein
MRYLNFLPRKTGFDPRSVCVSYGGHGNIRTNVYSEYFGFTLSLSFHQCSLLIDWFIHSFIHHRRCVIVAVFGIVQWNANSCVREWVVAGTSVVTCYEVASVKDLSLSICLVLRNRVHCVNESDLVYVRLWFYIIAETSSTWSNSDRACRNVMYRTNCSTIISMFLLQRQICTIFGVNSTWM